MGCEFLNSLTCVSKIWIWKHLAFTCAGRKAASRRINRLKGTNCGRCAPGCACEMRADARSPYLFLSERGPMTRQAFNYLVAQTGKRAKLRFHVHPHMLRHSTGYYLANRNHDTRLIQDYLGHKNIAHTVRYTRTAASRFEGLWR